MSQPGASRVRSPDAIRGGGWRHSRIAAGLQGAVSLQGPRHMLAYQLRRVFAARL